MATCLICPDEHVPDLELVDHIRLLHPDYYHECECGFERWPDGDIVIYDTTTEPYEWEKP